MKHNLHEIQAYLRFQFSEKFKKKLDKIYSCKKNQKTERQKLKSASGYVSKNGCEWDF